MNLKDELLGDSPGIEAVRKGIERLLQRSANIRSVLIQGETGTGKGLVARALHRAGPRAGGPFVDVNCAAIPETLLEAEMFGFERGAFTDARQAKPGLFQAAHRGTLFLDEIGAVPESLQTKLLKVIEDHTVRRLGSTRSEPVDVWIVAATSVDLLGATREGRFRPDLYHRLAIFTIWLPPLRERGEDIIRLAEHFLARACADHGLPAKQLSADARESLMSYPWPGNVRELSNALERAALLADERVITATILALPIGQEAADPLKTTGARTSTTHDPAPEQGSVALDDAVRVHISEVLVQTGWNLSRAAALLGISRNTLHARIRKYGLQPAAPRHVGRAVGDRQGHLAPSAPEKVPSPEPKPWDQRSVAYLFTTFRLPPPGLEPVSAGRVLPVIADKVEMFGGRVEERMPTGVLSVFGLEPVDNAPSIAALAALAIQAELLRNRDSGGALTPPMMVVHAARVDVAEGPGEPLLNFQSKATAWGTLTSLLADAVPGAIVVSRTAEPFLRRRFSLTSSTAEGHQTYRLVRRYDAPLRHAQNEFIGREGQLQILREAFGRIGTRRGLVVAVVGDPGVGKSRLVHEALRDINEWGILQCRAEPYGRSTSYLPFAALLRVHCRIEDSDEPADIRSKVTQSLLGSDNRLSDAVPPLLELLHALPANDPFVTLDPPVRRQRTLESLKRVVTSIADERPLCLVVEDLQWIDSESQACLDMLVDSLASIRLTLIVEYRPEYQHSWSNKSYYTQIRLNPLESGDVQRLLSSLLGEDGSLGELKELLVSRCEGNPFFIEENVQALLETGAVAGEPGHYWIDGALGSIEIPTTVQAVLAARIGRLPADAKRVLQAASVIGDEIPLPILQVITDSFGEGLHAPLELLQAAEFLYEWRRGPLIGYMFKHALTRDVAYEGILDEPRARLHSRIVEAIETLYPDRLAEYVERLAYHGVRGKVWGKSVTYLRKAAAKAFALSANRESTVFLEEALAAVEHLPDDQARLEQAFEIRLELRPVLNLLGEVRQVLERLREAETLAEQLNDDRRRGRVFAFVTNVHSLVGELDLALAFGSRALTIAQMLGDLELRIITTTYLEHAHYLRGEYERVIELATANLAALPPDRVYEYFGNAAPASIYDRCWLVMSLAQIGRFAEANEHAVEAIRLASPTHHAFTLGLAYRAASTLEFLKGDWAKARSLIEAWIPVVRTGNVVLQLTRAVASSAWILAHFDEASEALNRLREGEQLLERHAARGLVHNLGWDYYSLGRACLLLGRLDEARHFGDRAAELSLRHPGFAAHALHLLGDVATHPDRFDAQGGEAHYRKALALAEPRGMSPLVALCHLGLGKLYRCTKEPQAACEHLDTAITMCRTMGMRFWLERGEEELKRLS